MSRKRAVWYVGTLCLEAHKLDPSKECLTIIVETCGGETRVGADCVWESGRRVSAERLPLQKLTDVELTQAAEYAAKLHGEYSKIASEGGLNAYKKLIFRAEACLDMIYAHMALRLQRRESRGSLR